MMPGGHLATSVALSGIAYAFTGSLELAAGCIAGGFLIDIDHYLDYLVFERQWRRPSPVEFLRYYFRYSPKKLVLPLHSAELMTLLLVVIWVRPMPWLIGYWLGTLMHLVLDVLINGENALRRPVLFYIFSYRASKAFAAGELLDVVVSPGMGRAPIREFFRWRPVSGNESTPDGKMGS